MPRFTPQQITQVLEGHVDENLYGAENGVTKCNIFVRKVAESLIQQSRPELQGLANQQFDNLSGSADWLAQSVSPDNAATLQNAHEAANAGNLVVVAYKNPDANAHGHIAIIAPADAMAPSTAWGAPVPFVGQAGPKNPRDEPTEVDVSVFAKLKLSFGFAANKAPHMSLFTWNG